MSAWGPDHFVDELLRRTSWSPPDIRAATFGDACVVLEHLTHPEG